MIIKRHQLAGFYQAIQKDLACKLVTHVARTFPAEVLARGEQAIRQQVRAAVELGERHGMQEEYELCRLVDLVFLLGEDFAWFDRQPCVSQVLADKGLDENARMNRLYEVFGRQIAQKRSGESRGTCPSVPSAPNNLPPSA